MRRRGTGRRRARTRWTLAAVAASVLTAAGGGSASASTGSASIRPSVSAPTSVLTYGYDDQRSGYNAAEATLTNANASSLHRLWSVDLGAVMTAQPVEAAGVNISGTPTNVIYEGTEHGDFYALDAADGSVIWHSNLGSQSTGCEDMPDGVFGIGGSAVISFTGTGTGVVYVAGGDGKVHALDLATGTERSGWPVLAVVNPKMDHVYGALTMGNGQIYVTSASHCDVRPFHGTIDAIDIASHTVVAQFFPAGGVYSGGGIWGPGGVSVDPSTGHVFAATGNAVAYFENYSYSEAMVELSSSLQPLGAVKPPPIGGDNDFGATPILFQPSGCQYTLVAAMRKFGGLVFSIEGYLSRIYRQANMGSGPGQFDGIPAWDPATQMLYIGNPSDSTPFEHGMVALQAHSNCTLSIAWQTSVGPNLQIVSPPTVGGGVVYYGDGPGNTEHAFNAATGTELWNSGSVIGGPLFAAPMVANGQLIVPSWDHRVYAFGP